jgi:hypothetical protein
MTAPTAIKVTLSRQSSAPKNFPQASVSHRKVGQDSRHRTGKTTMGRFGNCSRSYRTGPFRRRRWDLNPRPPCGSNALAGRPIRPLWHLSRMVIHTNGAPVMVRPHRTITETTFVHCPEAWPALAEGAGFEPAENLRPRRFSRPVHSAALPPLRSQTYRTALGHPMENRPR